MLKGSAGEWVFVGIGVNLGNPPAMIATVLQELSEIAVGEVISSSIWRSEASGMEGGDFGNAVVKFEFGQGPLDLLKKLQDLEVKHGRPRNHDHYTSRTLDLDIIAFGNQTLSLSNLSIPHAHAHERLFVLLPLKEIDLDFRFVGRAAGLQQLIDKAEGLRIGLWYD